MLLKNLISKKSINLSRNIDPLLIATLFPY